jgi:hypothetical protein
VAIVDALDHVVLVAAGGVVAVALSHDSPTCREASGRGGRLATGLVDVRLDVGFELHDPRSDVERLVRTPRSERQACDPDEAAQR